MRLAALHAARAQAMSVAVAVQAAAAERLHGALWLGFRQQTQASAVLQKCVTAVVFP